MRTLVMLMLSTLLAGCCHAPVQDTSCGPAPGCKTDCPDSAPRCRTGKASCPSCPDRRPCPAPPKQRCRSSLTLDWKPVRYPVLRVRKMHETCPPNRKDCRSSGCLTDAGCGTVHSRENQSGRTPFGNQHVPDAHPVLNPPPQPGETAIPGLEPSRSDETEIHSVDQKATSAGHQGSSLRNEASGGIPEIFEPGFSGTTARSSAAYADQRFAVEMWPHSPQYTGRR